MFGIEKKRDQTTTVHMQVQRQKNKLWHSINEQKKKKANNVSHKCFQKPKIEICNNAKWNTHTKRLFTIFFVRLAVFSSFGWIFRLICGYINTHIQIHAKNEKKLQCKKTNNRQPQNQRKTIDSWKSER